MEVIEELRGKSVIITGASRGIGAASARYLAACGMRVVLASRSLAPMRELVGEIERAGGVGKAAECDVSDFQSLEALAQRCVSDYGSLDILINNAAVIDPIARLDQSDPQDWATAVDINFKGVYFGLRAVLPHMLRQGGGTIVNISSGAAHRVLEGWSHYCSTKAGVYSLTQSVDLEYRGSGVRSVGLSPGTVDTSMQKVIKASGINPVSQLDPSVHISPDDVARAIAWLCTSAADDLLGTDFSLNSAEARQRIGLQAR